MSIINLKENWDRNVPTFRHKVSDVLNSANKKSSRIENPFLDKSGKLVNPYINYQKMLDNSDVSTKAKDFIQQATGLSPTVTAYPARSGDIVTPTVTATPMRSDNIVTPTVSKNTTEAEKSSGSNIVDAAKKYIGTPYVWGGESMSEGGMDCSGFVYNALKDAGYNAVRTTAQGYRSFGTQVSKSDMQPGDLIFFGKNGKATHIGIYMGDGKIIHSSGGDSRSTKENPGKGVSISNVDYRNDFLEARRY